METVAHSSATLASRLLQWCARAFEGTSEGDVIGRLDDEALREIARDCCVTPGQLLQLAKAGPGASDDVIALMKVLDIDPDEAARAHGLQFRDMQITCSTCTSKDRCRRDLARGAAEHEHVRYCGNAAHLGGMRAEAKLLTA